MIETTSFTWTAKYRTDATRTGLETYNRARLQSKASRILGWVLRRTITLESLDAALDRNCGAQYEAGLQTVPIRQIRGTEGRHHDFDRAFRPLSDNTRDRWLSIYHAQAAGVSLPPVELIRVGDSFYVRDGHHRISVARALGQRFIDAQVIVRQDD